MHGTQGHGGICNKPGYTSPPCLANFTNVTNARVGKSSKATESPKLAFDHTPSHLAA